jgi:dihydroxyacid dehydratase/phosphogluconate dehydratase
MGSPEAKKGLFAGAVRTGDAIQIDLDSVSG